MVRVHQGALFIFTTMKRLFNEDCVLDEDGVKISDEFGLLISSFVKEKSKEYNTIELEYVLTHEVHFSIAVERLKLQNQKRKEKE